MEYQKIPGPYRRETEGPNRNRLIEGQWTSPTLEVLANVDWIFTEKVDGTNIRVMWDGHRVAFGGRTDRAQIQANLVMHLVDLFPEELLEQAFGGQPVTFYGEGYGHGIQSGGWYRSAVGFVLFDVRIGDWWLLRTDVEDVASKLGIDIVPVVLNGTLTQAIELVRAGLPSAWNPDRLAEGVVGVTRAGLLDRSGNRVIVKIKTVDFKGDA